MHCQWQTPMAMSESELYAGPGQVLPPAATPGANVTVLVTAGFGKTGISTDSALFQRLFSDDWPGLSFKLVYSAAQPCRPGPGPPGESDS